MKRTQTRQDELELRNEFTYPREMILLTIAALLVSVGDIYTTVVLYGKGYTEANYLMRILLDTYGTTGFVFVNAVLSFIIIYILVIGPLKYLKNEGKWMYVPLLIYCIGRGAAVVNNVLVWTGNV